MLYESQNFEYIFSEKGKFVVKVMNIPNVSLDVEVTGESPNERSSFCNSKMSLSFMSSQSLSSFIPDDSFLQCLDHKMNRNRPVEVVNFLRPDQTNSTQFCDYFGVKSSLLKKYQILNRLFRKNESPASRVPSHPESQLFSGELIGQVQLGPDPSTESAPPDSVSLNYLFLLRNRFHNQHDLN